MYPRRVKDLPPLETDSEDEPNTPLARKGSKKPSDSSSDKENESHSSNNALNKNINSFGPFRNFPKRSSELPALESDSDEDDNLNCAILNESFILTPVKDEQKISRIAKTCSQDQFSIGGVKAPVVIDHNPADSSLVKRFQQMGLNGVSHNATPSAGQPSLSSSVCSLNSVSHSQNKNMSACHLKSITEDEEIATVKRFHSDSAAAPNEPQFATPQIRSFSVQRRPRDICSTQSQKTRSAVANEFRTPKVLFQTPLATTRAPNPCPNNDSLTLSLCDSIDELHDKTPSTCSTVKSKKSLDGIFNEVDKKESSCDVLTDADAMTAASLPSNNKAITTIMTTGSNCKETILEINNGNYAILRKLGAGGSSSVYLAQNKGSGKECALKIVDLRGDAAIVEGYLNETKLLAKLQGNACVVSLYDYQLRQKESKLYMVMEKGDSDLSKILQRYRTSLPLYVLMNFWYQMLQAVNYIHQNGVIHSDLKPANFLMVNGRLKLIDFGIASNIAVDSTSIIKYSQAGTFNYISPEALTDTSTGSSPIKNQPKIKISPKSDVWSLGCILYLLIYKKTPFSHILSIYAKISAISNPTPTIDYPAIPPYYPPMLLQMVKSCLQHNPKQRPSCADLLEYPFHMVIPIKNLTLAPK